jgi:hypothetical protein
MKPFRGSANFAAKQNPKRDKYDESPIGFCQNECDHFSSVAVSLWATWDL